MLFSRTLLYRLSLLSIILNISSTNEQKGHETLAAFGRVGSASVASDIYCSLPRHLFAVQRCSNTK